MTQTLNAPVLRRHSRRLAPILLLPLALGLVACGAGSPAAPEGLVEGQATLTAAAAAALPLATEPGLDPEAGQLATPGGPNPAEAPVSIEDLVGDSGAPIPTDPVLNADAPVDPDAAAAESRATADAEAGIPNVNALVLSMDRLATFTPGPQSAAPDAELIYARNGSFWRIGAGGGDARKLDLGAEVPPLWAPPEDPGRGWLSPDGKRVAFFAGSDAEMWVTGVDGRGARRLSGPNLPPETHAISGAGGESQVRLQPGRHYTLIRLDAGDQPFAVQVDDLSEQRRGYARLRFVHLISGRADEQLQVYANGSPFGGPMRLGRSSGEIAVPASSLTLELRDMQGKRVSELPALEAASKQILTVFLLGDETVRAVPVVYEKALDPGTASEVRIFNASDAALDVQLDGATALVADLAPAAIGPYVRVLSTLSTEQRADLQLGIYGNKTREYPVVWSPDSERLAWIGGGDGQVDLFSAEVDGTSRRVTNDALRELNPVWSPDGHLVWIAEESAIVRYEMFFARLGGQPQPLDLTAIRKARGLAPTVKVFFPNEPIWVDGDRFALEPHADNASLGIWMVDTRDGGVTSLYDEPVFASDWSETARAWVFNPDEETGTLRVLPFEGQARVLVDGDAYHGLWSPDGKQISYVEGQRMNADGWVLHAVGVDGKGDRALTPSWPLQQGDPPLPGPNAKRRWTDDGKRLIFSRVGRDYGAAERAGMGRIQEAGPDLENWYAVPVDGSAPPRMLTDLTQAFYLTNLAPEASGSFLAFTGLWYKSRTQQLWAVPATGGKPSQLDGPVRWFAWIP